MAELRSFADVLTAAINDLMEHGYDSIERVDRWTRELRLAAERQMQTPEAMEQLLKDGLAAIYKTQITEGGILKYHPRVARFGPEMVKPQLRAELDRRLASSAGLIRIRREEAMEATMRRWQGWATSVPPNGVSGEKRAEVKAAVQKSIKNLPFEERRVLIDQGHKMVASLSEIIAADGGAIAGLWRSNYRQAGYDYREDHKERDNRVYLIRDSWAHRAGLVKKGKNAYYDEITAPGQEPFCRCYMIWLYNLRDLPDDMVTQAGKRKLVEVGMHTNATRGMARADSARPMEEKDKALYMPWWSNRQTRCQRCEMFTAGENPQDGRCSEVEGSIAYNAHCKLFTVKTGARADGASNEGAESADIQPAIGMEAIRRQVDRLRQRADKS